MTLPLINRLDRIDPDTIRRMAAAMGFALPAGVPPQTAVPLGLFEAPPREILRGMIALGRVLGGRTGDVPMPHLLAAIGDVGADGGVVERPFPARGSLSGETIATGIAPASSYIRSVLDAPLGPGGTLASLQALRPVTEPRLIFHIAKTGTSTTATGATRDAMIAGAFATAEGVFAYLVLVGTASPSRPLGTLDGGALAPLVRLMVDDVLHRGRDDKTSYNINNKHDE
jgi:hypothetical protein